MRTLIRAAGDPGDVHLYEILHAIEHHPYEWWKHATEHPRHIDQVIAG